MELLGKPVVDKIYEKIKKRSNKDKEIHVIQVGNNEASNVYVSKKMKVAETLEIPMVLHKFDEDVMPNKIIRTIEQLNGNDNVTGIFVQLPLPDSFNENEIINTISPIKDLDGLTETNLGRLFSKTQYHTPCTAQGIVEMLKHYNIKISGQNICIIGRSNLVGKPLFHLLNNENATVTLCHSHTKNIKEITKKADIIVVAVGIPKFLTSDMVSQGQTIIDVGINRLENGLVGDVDYENVQLIVEHITPVPRGVGLTTVACLMENAVKYQ